MSVRSPLLRKATRTLHWIRWACAAFSARVRAIGARARGIAEPAPTLMLPTRLNGRDGFVPMRVEAPIRCSEIYRAGELVRRSGGYEASLSTTRMIAAQIWLTRCAPADAGHCPIATVARQLLQAGMEGLPDRCMPLGCIPALDVRRYAGGDVEVTLYSECVDVAGRRAIEAAARAIAAPLARLVRCAGEPRIRIGVLEATRARLRCRLDLGLLSDDLAATLDAGNPSDALALGGLDELLEYVGLDRHQPQVAASHNDHVLRATTAAAAALGLEPWRMEAAARSHALRWGSCEPLARWRRQASELTGYLVMPVDVENARRVLPASTRGSGDPASQRRAAGDRLLLAASVGLAASLAYLRLALILTRSRSAAAAPSETQSEGHGRFADRRSLPDPRVAESGVHPSPTAGRSALSSQTG